MSRHWWAWLALGLVLAGLAVALSDRYVHPQDATVLVLPLGRGDKLGMYLWGPAPDLRVVVHWQTAASSRRLLAFTVPAFPWYVAMCLAATGLMVSHRIHVAPRKLDLAGSIRGLR